MSRRYPKAPIAAVGVVICDGGRVVLIHRRTEPAKGSWPFAGVVVRFGETIGRAAQRDALEETGLRAEAEELVTAVGPCAR